MLAIDTSSTIFIIVMRNYIYIQRANGKATNQDNICVELIKLSEIFSGKRINRIESNRTQSFSN